MGVYAREHAQQLILDLAGDDITSPISPRAQLLLLHIALKFGGDQSIGRRDVTKGTLWHREAVYMEGLGKKARAIGYNVPEKIDTHPATENPVSATTYNRVKAAVNKAVKELMEHGFIVQTRRGQTGMTATYSLSFLRRSCSKCAVLQDGEKFMDETLHLNQDQREKEFGRIAESRIGNHSGEDIRESVDPWAAKAPSSWGKNPSPGARK